MKLAISRSVVILCFPPVDIFDVAGPLEVFRLVNLLSRQHKLYDVVVVNAGDDIMVETEAGTSLLADATIAQLAADDRRLAHLDTLIVVSGLGGINRYPAAALDWIARHRREFRRLCSVCMGAFPLAASGVLDGRRVTTHWRMLDVLSRLYGGVRVEDAPIWVKDGRFYSSAGLATGIDLMLGLVEEDLGHGLATDVAREMVLYIRRPAGHSQKSSTLELQNTPNKRLQALQPWLMDNLGKNLDTNRLAERLAVSRRTLIRLFRTELDTTPAKHIESMRIDAVARYLTTTDWSLEAIARKCGFASADVMRRVFQRRLSISPAHFRQEARSRPTRTA